MTLVGLVANPGFSADTGEEQTKVDSLEFDSRFALYRYLQRGFEEYFDKGDVSRLADLELAARYVSETFGDDFYLRQCDKFKNWRENYLTKRRQLKVEYSLNQQGLNQVDVPADTYCDQMMKLADAFLELGDSASAVNCLQVAGAMGAGRTSSDNIRGLLSKSLAISRAIGDLDGLSRSYNLTGRFHEQRAEFIKAGAYFDSARVIKFELGDLAGSADALNNIASVYLSIGDKANSLRFAEEALQQRRELGDSTQVLQSLLMIIPAFARDVPDSTAQQWLNEADRLSRLQSEPQPMERLAYSRGVIAELGGELDSALSQYSQALAIATGSKNHRLALAILQNLAALESSMGRFSESVAHYVAAQELATNSRNSAALATIYHNLGSLHQRLGDLELASDYYRRALEIRRQLDMRIQSAETLGNLAELYLTTGDPATAEVYIRQAIQVAQLAGDRRRLASALTRLAHLRQLNKDYVGAMAELDSAEAVESESQTPQRRIDYLCLRAEFSRQAQELAQADRYLSDAYRVLDSCATYTNRQRVDIIRAELAADRKRWREAYTSLATVIARSEQLRGSIPNPQLRTSFQGRSRFVYEHMVKTLFNLRKSGEFSGGDDSLLAYTEKAKSRGLLDAVYGMDGPNDSRQWAHMRSEESNLLREVERVEQSLADDGDAQSIKRKISLLANLETRLTDLRLKQGAAISTSARIYSPQPISIRKIQSSLPDERTALISFLLTPESSYVILLDRRRFTVEEIPGRSEISARVAEFARLIQVSIKDESLLDSLDAIAELLGKQLLPRELFAQGNYNHLLICADGILSVLPFEALRFNDRYLIESSAIASVPSLYLYGSGSSNSQPPKATRLLALADPRNNSQLRQLPFSAREVDWISEAFGKSNCTILTATRATKSELLRLNLSDYGIVHVATHSTINYTDPRRSKIWLSADSSLIDGESILSLAEIGELELSADLVVLSSCESGGGSLDIGEGLDGFAKAFLQAGAGNLVVSLWEVEDFTTAAFMKTFYNNLKSGYADALRTAKLEMITSPRLRHRHPYYWSPFKLIVGRN